MLDNLSNTSGQPNAVVVIQPGLQVQPVVLVDQYGSAVTISGGSVASFLATLTSPVNVSLSSAPSAGYILTAVSATAATWQAGLTNPMTTPGDMIAGGAAGAATRLAGNTTSTRQFLTSTGSGGTAATPAWGTIAVSDVPTLNQNTTGTAATATAASALNSATTTVIVSTATAPSANQVLTATSGSAATWQNGIVATLTTPGDIVYESAGTVPTRLAGNTSTQREFLLSQGGGSAASAPTWAVVPGQMLCAPKVYAPGSLTALAGSGTTMFAFASGTVGTNTFTAPATGNVQVTLDCMMKVSAGGGVVGLGIAATGSTTPLFGNAVNPAFAGANIAQALHVPFYITGLTAGSAYTFDLLGSVTSGDTVTINAQGTTATTVQATAAGPVLMNVLASL